MIHKWVFLFEVPYCHRWFASRERIAVCDNSGSNPEETDDGLWWLDTDKQLGVDHNGDVIITLINDRGQTTVLGGTSLREAMELVHREYIRWAARVEPAPAPNTNTAEVRRAIKHAYEVLGCELEKLIPR